jgi:hypothetical protein
MNNIFVSIGESDHNTTESSISGITIELEARAPRIESRALTFASSRFNLISHNIRFFDGDAFHGPLFSSLLIEQNRCLSFAIRFCDGILTLKAFIQARSDGQSYSCFGFRALFRVRARNLHSALARTTRKCPIPNFSQMGLLFEFHGRE